jgi:DNA-directed RNA polymerase delta subunit
MKDIQLRLNLGLFFNNMHDLKGLLQNRPLMTEIGNNVWKQRHFFTFDYHADELINFFKTVIKQSQEKKGQEKEILVLPLIA